MVEQKDRSATEFATRANAIIEELKDPKNNFTLDEVNKRADEVKALKTRAQMIAGFTPDEEIEDQGGDALLRRGAPDARRIPKDVDPNGVSFRRQTAYQTRMAALAEDVDKAFGGPNALILALAKRSIEPLDTNQSRVLKAIDEFQQRTIVGTTGDSSKAEVLLPLQQEHTIFSVANEVAGIITDARRYTLSGRTLKIPYVVQTNGANDRPTAGIANVAFLAEGAQKPVREPKFEQRALEAFKIAAYAEIGDEILADDMTGELAPTLQTLVGGQIMNFLNEQITIDGGGSSAPLAAFHNSNPSLLKVTRQTQNDLKIEDIFEMYARHIIGPKSKWYIHSSVLPKLMKLTLSGTTLVSFLPSLQGKPTMQLLGLPIVVTDLLPTLGFQADVCLGNGDFYAFALRTALTIQSSIHYKFREDITAYRFFARGGGVPIPDGTYSYKSTSSVKDYAKSPFVVLDDVYV